MSGEQPVRAPDRRRAARIRARIEAAYEDEASQVFYATRDVSERGLYLLAPDPPEIGGVVRVLLELPGQTGLLRLSGTVCRSEPGKGFAIALEPDDLSDLDRSALRAFSGGG